jgi:aspartate ammonia-lyase
LLRSVATVKRAVALCNRDLGYLDSQVAEAIAVAADSFCSMSDTEIAGELPLDAYQGGAGTSTNMAVNEWLAERAGQTLDGREVDPHDEVNLHQSTNDVMPTALRLMMHDLLERLEGEAERLQAVLQEGETAYDLRLQVGRTELRDAVVTTLGREYGTWAHGISRDRWRCFKARERIREVNLGGTAIGTGAGAPRQYVLHVCRYLQQEVDHPINRAEHLVEATSNYDQVVEAMDAVKCLAVNLRRIASDLRLLASGPRSGLGEIDIPNLLPGSSIMAGKVNPVIPEAVIQCSERILANDALLSRLASMSELELNAFFPGITQAVYESLTLALGAVGRVCDYLPLIVPRAGSGEASCAQAQAVALLPLLSYDESALLVRQAEATGEPLDRFLVSAKVLSEEEAQAVFAPANLLSLGYDEELYDDLRRRRDGAIKALVSECRKREELQ